MDEPPGHAVDLKLAARRRGDRAGEFAAGDRVAGKAETREWWERFAHGGKAWKRGSEIGQIGPFVHQVERPGIGEAAAADLLGEHEVEPRASSAAIKISRAHNDDACTALGCFRHAIFDRHSQLSLPR